MWQRLRDKISGGDIKALARGISLVENRVDGFEEFLRSLEPKHIPVIGITGPPGAGKSTLTDALIGEYVKQGEKVAVLCVDPSSPFNLGALLGDRIRMNRWYEHPSVFIRSLASRGSLGGLHPNIIPLIDVITAAGYNRILIETVGVGQSEIEIAGIADITIVVLVPESGDEVQTMKSGLMEIADLFIVNKADRPGADALVNELRKRLGKMDGALAHIPVIATIASQGAGIAALKQAITEIHHSVNESRRAALLAEKAYQMIAQERMRDIDKEVLRARITEQRQPFNLYAFVESFRKSPSSNG